MSNTFRYPSGYSFIFRKKKTISYSQRIRINTPDNDFLDIDFVDHYMQIDPELKIPCPSKQRMEKQLIRDAFNTLYPDLLPQEVMYRKKEAFSDGVSIRLSTTFILPPARR